MARRSQVPEAQLVDKDGVCGILSNETQQIMVLSPSRFLSILP